MCQVSGVVYESARWPSDVVDVGMGEDRPQRNIQGNSEEIKGRRAERLSLSSGGLHQR